MNTENKIPKSIFLLNFINRKTVKIVSVKLSIIILFAFLFSMNSNCVSNPFKDPGFVKDATPIQIFYNDPGQDQLSGVDKKIDGELVKLINEAEFTVDIAVYNLGRQNIIDALIMAEARGVKVRMVGDIDEAFTYGYQAMLRTDVDVSLGNSTAIQHNKFAVIDGKYLFAGTGNITNSGFLNNNNNFMIVQDKIVCDHYTKEFNQMYSGLYAGKKIPREVNKTFRVGATNVEVYFSPYQGEAAMDAIINAVNSAKKSIHYMIFAYTHDELTSALIRAAHRKVMVKGINDTTFVSGVSEETPRLFSALYNNNGSENKYGPFVHRDGNEHTSIVGNPGHGGKLHCKTIIIDEGTDDAVTFTGSFNWSNNAINNNDENLVVLHSKKLTATYMKQWHDVWDISIPLFKDDANPDGRWQAIYGSVAEAGDVIISEVNWGGLFNAATGSTTNKADWIELKNRTSKTIDLSHWIIQWGIDRDTNNFAIPDSRNAYKPSLNPVGNKLLGSNSYGLDKSRMIIWSEKNPAFNFDSENNEDYGIKVSGTKKFSLEQGGLKIRLFDKQMNLIDEVGLGGPPFYGSKAGDEFPFARSMQRYDLRWHEEDELRNNANDGKFKSSWYETLIPGSASISLTASGTYSSTGTNSISIPDGSTGFAANKCAPGFNYANVKTIDGDGNIDYTLISYNGVDDSSDPDLLLNVKILSGATTLSYNTDTVINCYLPTISQAAVLDNTLATLTLNASDGSLFADPANKNPVNPDFYSTFEHTESYTILISDIDNKTDPVLATYTGKDNGSSNVLSGISCETDCPAGNYNVHFLGSYNELSSAEYLYFNRSTPLRVNSATPGPSLASVVSVAEKEIEVSFNKEMDYNDVTTKTNYNIPGLSINYIYIDDENPALYHFVLNSSMSETTNYTLSINGSINDKKSGQSLTSGSYNFAGFSNTKAEVFLSEIAPTASTPRTDFIRLLVTSAGSLQGLRLFMHDDKDPILLYEFHSLNVEANDEIVIHIGDESSCNVNEDLSLDKASCANASYSRANDLVWDIYINPEDKLANAEGAVMLAYSKEDGDYSDMDLKDFACYSTQDGEMPEDLITLVLLHYYKEHSELWSFTEEPLFNYNDAIVQKDCINWENGKASQLMQRSNFTDSPAQASFWHLNSRLEDGP